MAQEQPRNFDPEYQRYLSELDDLLPFTYAERGHAGSAAMSAAIGRGTAWFKQADSATGELMSKMGRMVAMQRTLLDVALAVIRGCNPHTSRGEWEGKLFADAREALRKNYDDVELRSGPESVRLRDCVRPYTRAEKLIVLETLHSVCRGYIGVGWAAQRCAEEESVCRHIAALTGKDPWARAA